MGRALRSIGFAGTAAVVVALIAPHDAGAYISQVDGTVLPQTTRLQQCLDRPGTGETAPGAVDAIADAAVLPEAYRPVPDVATGSYDVTFVDIGEGAGYTNSFGWFWIGEDITVPGNLHPVFGCRGYASCACPCATTRTTTIDFDTQPGFSPGRPIGFWLRTPELLVGGNDADNCGNIGDTANRIYFTSKALNDDGDFIHFLVYRSATRTNTFYFGFEDLFRGGDNDFEDMLVRATGLVPLCDPRPETCNNLDDDCDGVIDDGITMPCATACGAGTRTCAAGVFGTCSAPVPGVEICNNVDDNCNGETDEGITRPCTGACGPGTEVCRMGAFTDCSAPSPTIESCNNVDDDCDGMIDEGLSRACFTACGSGTETCTAGAYTGCTAPVPGTETCNNVDDDCDGLTDEGLSRGCSSACGSGTEICIAGAYVGCTAPVPGLETCNNVDDDCDGMIDEGLSRSCSTACGPGTELCTTGTWGGCDAPTPITETCNNVDDDCDGVIDDGNPGGGAPCVPLPDGGFTDVSDGGVPMPDAGPDGGAAMCGPGRVRCVGGMLECRGASSPTREVCNCIDDDCDGLVDEETSGELCPGGACVACGCRSPCRESEFAPCPAEQYCDTSYANPATGLIGLCLPSPCAGTCSAEEVCDVATATCVNVCADVHCDAGFACVRGRCTEDNCYGRGCATAERCRAGVCEPDPCASLSCAADHFCREGTCVAACATTCGDAEECRDGACVPAACVPACPTRATCVGATCVPDTCSAPCGRGRVCRGDTCVDDPCAGIRCPDSFDCVNADCVPTRPTPPALPPVRGLATGGGGCACNAAGPASGSSSTPWALASLLALALLVAMRRRPRVMRSLALGASLACVASSIGCAVDPYCFENCGEVDAGPQRDASVDAQPADGCVATGVEECNGIDDDCNGIVDDGFDLENDPAHCGGCDQPCDLPNAFPECAAGECTIGSCAIGHVDLDGIPANGCEYACPPATDEICDGIDNDCDGVPDDGFDLTSDLANCGGCGNVCVFANADASCVASACVMGMCRAGYVDLDMLPETGCEYHCSPAGAEVCNGEDDDCNGVIDDGFVLATDAMNCGACGRACVAPGAVSACVAGDCVITGCAPGFVDLDHAVATGCEYPCTPSGAEICDGMDNDCNGAVDAPLPGGPAVPGVGASCVPGGGMVRGACTAGVQACSLGRLTCVGGAGPTPETCNGVDDDCDGMTDEAPLAGTGARCGATNTGACEYGTVVCAAGALVCGGAYVGPAPETCNGIDDDCDGTVDDSPAPPGATPASCVETRGVCAGRAATCRGAAGWACDLPATYTVVEARCDTLDNDCDGTTDEGCMVPAPATDVRVDTGDAVGAANSIYPFVAGDGAARVYAAWQDRRAGRAGIFFNRSTNTGTTWGAAAVRIDEYGGDAFAPQISVSSAGAGVGIQWSDFRGGTSYREIWSRYSADFGQTYPATSVRINPGVTMDSFGVDTAGCGSNVFVTFERFVSPRSRHIYMSASANGGQTWTAPLQVDHGAGASLVAATPRIACSGGNAYVIWRDNRNGSLDVFANRSIDGGLTVSAADTRLDVGTVAGSSSSFSPVIAAEGTNVYAAWVDDRLGGSFDIWTNHSTNSGATWLAADAVRIDADPFAHDSIRPKIVAPAAGRAIVGWIDYRGGFPDVWVARTTDSAATWGAPARIDTGTAEGTSGSYDVALGASGSRIVAAWADDRSGLLDIYANFSLDGGATWQPADYRMDSTPLPGTSDSETPSVFVTPTAGFVLWVDHRSGANGDIYFRRLQ